MNSNDHIDIEENMTNNAVSIIGDGADEFPVLKAFQQYIDAEQNKARKRMLSLCIFFGCLMTVVIVVFVFLLNGISQRNQALNDRLIEYVMKDREQRQAAVVVQPPSDQTAVFNLTTKIEEMQKKLLEAQQKAEAKAEAAAEQARADKAAAEAAIAAAKEKAQIKEQIEIQRLKAALAEEREKAAAEKEKKRQEELEAYRRKHYPEFYEKPASPSAAQKKLRKQTVEVVAADDEDEDEDIPDEEEDAVLDELKDDGAISYFEEEDETGKPLKKSASKPAGKPASYSIPVEVKGTRGKWRIPNN